MKPTPKRCVVYTRKSSEEGLDQTFNSLDAQREAGEAYVKSQSQEGWSILPARYDDGGYSGGTMERPGLRQLLADVEAGMIEVVVVYKIDRLTRSLSDFSRIVEIFEKAGTSFVSVTQSFNTTDSMGRLMLNVLLSFAQFEREVTGERIRDKISASKAKGMWMGGTLPLGYDRPLPMTHKLLINDDEAETVRWIFRRYLDLGSVHALQRELCQQGIKSKLRVTQNGRELGGTEISRGALFYLLRNQTYLGKIFHKDKIYDGEHEAIVDKTLFDKVQQLLDLHARRSRNAQHYKTIKAPLTGKLFDACGEPMSPTFSRGRGGKVYRYYVSASLQKGIGRTDEDIVQRLPAPAMEKLINEYVTRWLPNSDDPIAVMDSIKLIADGMVIRLIGDQRKTISARLDASDVITHCTSKSTSINVKVALPIKGGRRIITPANRRSAEPDVTLIAALRRAHRMVKRKSAMPVVETSPALPHHRKLLMLAFLAPDIQRDILAGKQPPMLNLEKLVRMTIPICWTQQRHMLGWQPIPEPCYAE